MNGENVYGRGAGSLSLISLIVSILVVVLVEILSSDFYSGCSLDEADPIIE